MNHIFPLSLFLRERGIYFTGFNLQDLIYRIIFDAFSSYQILHHDEQLLLKRSRVNDIITEFSILLFSYEK